MEMESVTRKRTSVTSEVLDSFYYINEKIPLKYLRPVIISASTVNLSVPKGEEVSMAKIIGYARERGFRYITLNEFLSTGEFVGIIFRKEYRQVGAIILGTEIKEGKKVFLPIVYRDKNGKIFLDLILRDDKMLWNDKFFFPQIDSRKEQK